MQKNTTKIPIVKERGDILRKELESLSDISSDSFAEIIQFYKYASEYLEKRYSLQKNNVVF